MALHAPSDEESGDDEFKDGAEDKQHAHEHPNIQEGDVGYLRYILANLWRIIITENVQVDVPS